jgi:uncharacterized membrane protein YfcA
VFYQGHPRMKTFRRYLVALVIAIGAVLAIAWFYKGGEHFKYVALVCYGYVIGWLSAAFVFRRKKSEHLLYRETINES